MRFPTVPLICTFVCSSVLAQDYKIYTFAGGGLPDNVPGVSVRIPVSGGVALDSAGNVYFAVTAGNVVYRIDATGGDLMRVAGTGYGGYSGDNGPALGARLHSPNGVTVNASGNLYIADADNHVVRKVSDGVITTFAGC